MTYPYHHFDHHHYSRTGFVSPSSIFGSPWPAPLFHACCCHPHHGSSFDCSCPHDDQHLQCCVVLLRRCPFLQWNRRSIHLVFPQCLVRNPTNPRTIGVKGHHHSTSMLRPVWSVASNGYTQRCSSWHLFLDGRTKLIFVLQKTFLPQAFFLQFFVFEPPRYYGLLSDAFVFDECRQNVAAI